jgi:SAM-dependent methyltransferase
LLIAQCRALYRRTLKRLPGFDALPPVRFLRRLYDRAFLPQLAIYADRRDAAWDAPLHGGQGRARLFGHARADLGFQARMWLRDRRQLNVPPEALLAAVEDQHAAVLEAGPAGFAPSRPAEAAAMVHRRHTWRCNICGCTCQTTLAALTREDSTCAGCGSSVRFRAIVRLISTELFGASLDLGRLPRRKDLRGLGLTDWNRYADVLASQFNYTNTFFDEAPRLDITVANLHLEAALDFLIASDVFEHIAPPADAGFANACRLLKPGGVFIFSVPYSLNADTLEHYPDLYRYEIVRTGPQPKLVNTTRDGRQQVFEQLVFHGGPGESLEMRLFSEAALKREFEQAGFVQFRVHAEPDLEHGIYWASPWSLPITARRPRQP